MGGCSKLLATSESRTPHFSQCSLFGCNIPTPSPPLPLSFLDYGIIQDSLPSPT